jgi:hypothetical protein
MPKFRLWCTWHCGGWTEVEAESFDEAVNIAMNTDDLPDGEYLDDTFQVDEYASRGDGEQPSPPSTKQGEQK